jgi:hypothetical protein
MIDLREVRSVTEFQLNIKDYVGRLKENKTPLVLTVNGRAELVVKVGAGGRVRTGDVQLGKLAFEEAPEYLAITALPARNRQAFHKRCRKKESTLGTYERRSFRINRNGLVESLI